MGRRESAGRYTPLCKEWIMINLDEYENITKSYIGKGTIKTTDGEEIKCKFKVVQFNNGIIISKCDILEDIRNPLLLFNIQFKNMTGKTDKGHKLVLKTLSVINISAKWVFRGEELIVSDNKITESKTIKFAITNFEFSGNKLKTKLNNLNVTISKISNYKSVLNKLKTTNDVDITSFIKVEIGNTTNINKAKKIVDDLCIILTLASGTYVNWLYYEILSDNKTKEKYHRSAKTKPFSTFNLIPLQDKYLSNFIDDTFKSYPNANKNWDLRKAILIYTDAKIEIDFLEARGLKLAVAMEILKNSFSKNEDKNFIIDKTKFEKSNLQSNLMNLLREEFPEVKLQKINMMAGHFRSLNRYSFRKIINNIYEELSLNKDKNKINEFIIIRNKLVHEGKYLSNSENFNLSFDQYTYMLTFIGEIILLILDYKGYYNDWTKYGSNSMDLLTLLEDKLKEKHNGV